MAAQSTDTINVQLSCKKCGSSALMVEDKANDASPVSCKSCGFVFGSWGQVKELAKDAVADELGKTVRDAFRGIPGVKIT